MEETVVLECPKCGKFVTIIVDPAIGKYEWVAAFNTRRKSDEPWICVSCENNGVLRAR
jgi:hypothetical protein